ncbi:MAG: hypothetical protein A3B66_08560 [Alphaproteobacteria bacterium RIFCSPHIGHO2_02_FULL_46_13]|nr:MAG: hypothetical protein A3B66_08560 [Alphaproteobacteria bacterium RIFCSPHIGHO2_02_FULL_46_13]
MDDDYVLKYKAQFTPEGLQAHKKTAWPEGYNDYVLTGDPSKLAEYTLLKSNSDFWKKIKDGILGKLDIDDTRLKSFEKALLKAMTRMLFSKNNMQLLSGGNLRQLTPIRTKLQDFKITPFFRSYFISAIYRHLNEKNSEDEILNFDQAENIADFFENLLPLATKASNDAISFVEETQNTTSRKNIRNQDTRYKFSQDLIRTYIKYFDKKPTSTDNGLYIFLYEESCKVCGFKMQNVKIAKDALKDFKQNLEK